MSPAGMERAGALRHRRSPAGVSERARASQSNLRHAIPLSWPTPRRYVQCPRRESNPHLRFRKPPFYPLNYEDKLLIELILPITTKRCKFCVMAGAGPRRTGQVTANRQSPTGFLCNSPRGARLGNFLIEQGPGALERAADQPRRLAVPAGSSCNIPLDKPKRPIQSRHGEWVQMVARGLQRAICSN